METQHELWSFLLREAQQKGKAADPSAVEDMEQQNESWPSLITVLRIPCETGRIAICKSTRIGVLAGVPSGLSKTHQPWQTVHVSRYYSRGCRTLDNLSILLNHGWVYSVISLKAVISEQRRSRYREFEEKRHRKTSAKATTRPSIAVRTAKVPVATASPVWTFL